MPHITFREKEDFSRVEHAPMWLLPCKTCRKPFRITSGQILGFVDECPECLERKEKGLPPNYHSFRLSWFSIAVLVISGVVLAGMVMCFISFF